LVLGAVACAPSLSTMQPAHIARPGDFQMTAAMEVAVPTGTIIRAIDAGKSLSDTALAQGTLTPEQKQQVFEAGINLLASPPSFGPHLALNYGVNNMFEVGVRYAVSSWRLGTRVQLLRHEDGPFDLVIGAGFARSARKIPVKDFIPVLEADDFTRYTFDVPVTLGTSRSWYRVWTGAKVVHSRFDTAMRLTTPNEPPDVATFDGSSTFIGGLGGVAVGFRHIFFGVELTVGQMSGSAAVTSAAAGIASAADLSGLIIYPAFGFMGEI
jgi:hypothetical protein